jgi:hypothetical protein
MGMGYNNPMSNFSPVYILQQFFLRIYDFFYHWYVEGVLFLWRRFRFISGSMEQSFAIRVTAKHLFEPLYKDYSIIGHILGPIFRIGRVVIGSFFYLVMAVVFFVLIVVWVSIPLFIIVNIIHPIL